MKNDRPWQPELGSEHIRRIRHSMGESQAEFANRIRVNAVTVARWETGARKCSGEHATAIARLDPTGNPLIKDFLASRSEFSNFTDRALKAILLAQAETHRQGRHYIGTEQILLGLIGEGIGTASKCLRAGGANFGLAEIHVELRDGTGPYAIFKERALSARTKAMLDLPAEQTRFHILNFGIEYSGRAQEVIESAGHESPSRRRKKVGTGHLLLALLDLENCGGIDVLDSMGINRQQLKREINDQMKATDSALDKASSQLAGASSPDSAITQPVLNALQELREATEMSFLAQKYELAMWLRDRELELWKKLSGAYGATFE